MLSHAVTLHCSLRWGKLPQTVPKCLCSLWYATLTQAESHIIVIHVYEGFYEVLSPVNMSVTGVLVVFTPLRRNSSRRLHGSWSIHCCKWKHVIFQIYEKLQQHFTFPSERVVLISVWQTASQCTASGITCAQRSLRKHSRDYIFWEIPKTTCLHQNC